MGGDQVPDGKAPTMRGNHFLNFHRTAESAGYPALLIVSVVCLTLVVTPVALLALTGAAWVLALALLSLIAAVAILAGALDAAFSDYDEPAARRTRVAAAVPHDRDLVAPLPLRVPTTRHDQHDNRQAA